MEIKVENLSSVRRRLHFTVPGAQVTAAFQNVTQRYAAKVRVPGFRPGKAPAQMIERMHGTEIRRAVLDKLLKDNVFTAIDQAELRAVGRPEVEAFGDLARDSAFSVTCIFDVLPDLNLSGYIGAEIAVSSVKVQDGDVAERLEKKCRDRAELAPVSDGAQPGDQARVNYTIELDGETSIAGPITAEDKSFTLGDGQVPQQIDAAVLGHNAGETLAQEVELTADDVFYQSGARNMKYSVTIEELQRLDVPVLDDELAKDFGHADLAAWRVAVAAEAEVESVQLATDLREKAVIAHLLAVNPIEVPQAILREYVDSQMQQTFGNLDPKMLRGLESIVQKLRKDIARDGTRAFQRSMALETIAKVHEITVSDEQVQAALDALLQQPGARRADILRHYGSESGRAELRRREIIKGATDYLVSVATFSDAGELSLAQARNAAQPAMQSPSDDDDDFEMETLGHDHASHEHVHDENCNHDHHGHEHA